jgi:phosphatidylglycerophosphatase A
MIASIMNAIAAVIATFFGAGLSPKAPGTVGSIASLLLWAPLALLHAPLWLKLVIIVVIFMVGTWASQRMVVLHGDDPQRVVIDEVVGMGIAVMLTTTWAGLAVGFVLFRIFDIWKPLLVGWADKNVEGGFGVMLDDVIAGAMALVVMVAVELAWPGALGFATAWP